MSSLNDVILIWSWGPRIAVTLDRFVVGGVYLTIDRR